MKRLLSLFVGLLIVQPLAADVYRWIDEQGNVVFSDRPRPGAEKIRTVPVQTIPMPPAVAAQRPAPAPKSQAQQYLSFAIIAPLDEQNIHNPPEGDISVGVLLEPSLNVDKGHSLQLIVDGVPWGEPGNVTEFTLRNVDRGTHTLQAAIRDKEGNRIRQSPKVTFHVHRQSVLRPPPT